MNSLRSLCVCRVLPSLLFPLCCVAIAGAQTASAPGVNSPVLTAKNHQPALERKAPIEVSDRGHKPPYASPVFVTKTLITMHTSDDRLLQQTFYLPEGTPQNEANEVMVAVRNVIDPNAKIYLLQTRGAIVMNTTGDQLELTRRILLQLEPALAAPAAHVASVAYPQERTGTYTDNVVEQTFYLPQTLEQNDANEVQVALRNVLNPTAKIYLVPSKDAIVITTTSDQLRLAAKVISDLVPGR